MSKSQTVEQLLGNNPRLRERSDALDESLMTSSALLSGYMEKMNLARDNMQGAQADLNTLHHQYGHLPRVDDRESPGSDKRPGVLPLSVIDKAESAVSSGRENFNRVTVQKNRVSADKNRVVYLVADRDAYLARAAANGGLNDLAVKIPKGADLDSIPAEWAALRKDRKAVENAIRPITPDDIRALVNAKAEGARLVMTQRGQSLIEPPIVRVAAEPLAAGYVPNAPDALALMCRYAPEEVVTDLIEQAEKMAHERLVLTAEQKSKKLAEIDAEILRLQRIESELVWQARTTGQDVWFSKGLDIRAVLGVEGIAPK